MIFDLWMMILCWVISWSGCSTAVVAPIPMPTPPALTQVSHPQGTDLGDLSAIFLDPSAPQIPSFSENCDQDFLKLMQATTSQQEIKEGVKELVENDPVFYHWCFYGKLLRLEQDLVKDSYIDERQKEVLDTYSFLTPIARAFASAFHDSRYLRLAVTRYQKTSEWLFFRKLELGPKAILELVQPTNPFGLWRKSQGSFVVLQKYRIINTTDTTATTPATPATSATQPVAGAVPIPVAIPSVALPAHLPTPETSAVPALPRL